MKARIPIVVYRNQPIKLSETFVYNQSVKLKKYEAFILGAKYPQVPAFDLNPDCLKVINTGGIVGSLREILFKLCGIIPKDVYDWADALNPQIIHAHFGYDGAMIMPLAVRLNIPLIVSYLGSDATLQDKYMRRSYIRRRIYLLRRQKLIQRTKKVIVPSEFLKEKVIQQGFPAEKIHILHHGVDLCSFSNTRSTPKYGHILFVGRLVPRKGLNFLIEALSKVKSEFPEIYLTVIGDGPHRAEYESLAEDLLEDNFQFLGFQPHNVVRDHMSNAYIFSMPSITLPSGEAETFGLVFIEAQAMGVPVVSFASGGIPEVVKHGETGFLCEEGDIKGLTKYFCMLLKDSNLRNNMANQGQKRVKKMFSLEEQNKKLECFYKSIIHK